MSLHVSRLFWSNIGVCVYGVVLVRGQAKKRRLKKETEQHVGQEVVVEVPVLTNSKDISADEELVVYKVKAAATDSNKKPIKLAELMRKAQKK